jgi:hypothetical protein
MLACMPCMAKISRAAEYTLAETVAGVTAGAAISIFGIHESGHVLATLATGHNLRDVSYGVGSIDVKGVDVGSGDDHVIKMAGFGAQALATEIILNTPKIPKNNPIIAGILIANVLHPLAYALRAEAGSARDFDGYANKRHRRIAEAIVAGYSLFSAARIYKNDEFKVFLQTTKGGLGLVWSKTF